MSSGIMNSITAPIIKEAPESTPSGEDTATSL